MSLRSAIKAQEILDSAYATGAEVVAMFEEAGADEATYERLKGDGFTDVVRVFIKGCNGRSSGGEAPTLDISASLVGIGARPASKGLIGDGDAAIVACATGLRLLDMRGKGDGVDGDVVILMNITGAAPSFEAEGHQPPEIGCPVNFWLMKQKFVDGTADAILDVNVARNDRYCKKKGFAITPTVKEGWLLRVSEDALDVMERVTGEMPAVMPLSMQDVMPTRNGIWFLNDIGALPYGIDSPCIGVALCSPIVTNPFGPGMTNLTEIEPAIRFCVEVAKDFGQRRFDFYDKEEFIKIVKLYGSMKHLQTFGRQSDVVSQAMFRELVETYGPDMVK
ncbi:DUF1177 domain-containing protein [Synergistaceae bacterium OttesenSCG-928-I11]|nr:DUF1177 domain-containing protein [Synergistaceae bacterium OttesenSCG-928-I11]